MQASANDDAVAADRTSLPGAPAFAIIKLMYRSLSSLVPNAKDLLGLEIDQLGVILLTHLKSCEGTGSDVYQHGIISHHNFFNNLGRRGKQAAEYGDQQPAVNKALGEAWNWLETNGFLIRDPEQLAPWFYISRSGINLLEGGVAYRDSRQGAGAQSEASMDTLVPLQNSRGFKSDFEAHSKGPAVPMAIVLFDIDDFKGVNDDHGGHAIGDEALCSVAETAAACVRGKGTAYRLHGDEFVLFLPNHNLHEGFAVAERFRAAINASPRTSRKLTLSISAGVAEWPRHGAELDAVKSAADAALYEAKRAGKNLVRRFGTDGS